MEPNNQNNRVTGWLTAIKGLTLTNVLIITLLAVIGIPIYVVYKVMNDPAILERWQSSYVELPSQGGCALREAKMKGGTRLWAISTGFAYQGGDRWQASVILDHRPSETEIASFCESLKLITGAWESSP